MAMKTEYVVPAGLGILFVLIVAIVIAYVAGQGSNTNAAQQTNTSETAATTAPPVAAPSVASPSAETTLQTQNTAATVGQDNSNHSNAYYEEGSQSLCSQGAQDFVDSYNQAGVTDSQSTNLPAIAAFLISSHYVASQNSCYFELHSQVPLPEKDGGGVSEDHTLYVAGGPSAFEINTSKSVVASEVATCATYPNGQTSCNYFDPIENDQGSGGLTFTVWTDQYNTGPNAIVPAPSMSYADFQSLEARAMAAN